MSAPRSPRVWRLVACVLVVLAIAQPTGAAASDGAGPPLSYWQQRFDERLGLLGSDLAPGLRAMRISFFYASMANAHPDEMLWAGVASGVSAGLSVLLTVRAFGGIPGSPTEPVVTAMAQGPWDRALRDLGDANIAVARELGPLHIAYDEGGIAAIESLHDRHEIPDDINLGFHQMAAGGAAVSTGRVLGDTAAVHRGLASSLEGNTTLLHHEQFGAIQQYAFGRDQASWAVVAPVLAPLANAAYAAVGAGSGALLSFPYGLTDPAERTAFGTGLMQSRQKEEPRRTFDDAKVWGYPFEWADTSSKPPPPGGPGGGSSAGGVDFGRVGAIDYLATPPGLGASAVAFAVSGPAGTGGGPLVNPLRGSLAGDALLDFLVLDPDVTYVNLNPDQPDDIVPTAFRSRAGLVSLAADRELKRTVAGLIDPATPFGERWWDGAGPPSAGCTSARLWITLAPGARVWTNGAANLVIDAPLRVQLEGEDLHLNPNVGLSGETCKPDPAVVARYRNELLPLVTQAVNEAPEYADLRVVAKARVMAELVKANHQEQAIFHQSGCRDDRPCHRVLTDAEGPIKGVYDSYVASLRDGELRATQTLARGNQLVTRTVFYGGVDWSEAAVAEVDDARLRAERPQQAELLGAALAGFGPVPLPGGAVSRGGVLLDLPALGPAREAPSAGSNAEGGPVGVAPARHGPRHTALLLIVALPGMLGAAWAAHWRRLAGWGGRRWRSW